MICYLEGTGEHVGEFGFNVSLLSTGAVLVIVVLFRGGEGEPDPPDSKHEIPR